MDDGELTFALEVDASMGPRSEDRGDEAEFRCLHCDYSMLQWVHGPRTVVMLACRS